MVRVGRGWQAGLAVLVGCLLGASAAQAATTIHVKTSQDVSSGFGDMGDCATTDQTCSLRQAIATAENGDTVSLPAGTYQLTQNSSLVIPANITISGAGPRTTIIKELESNENVLDTGGSTAVTIQGVTITGGHAVGGTSGGGIDSNGDLTLRNSAVIGNKADGFQEVFNMVTEFLPGTGGGIYESGGTLTVVDSVISGNIAEPGVGAGAAGGGIASLFPVTLINSTVANNTAEGEGGPGGGSPDGFGGGIYLNSTGTAALTLDSDTIASNTADGSVSPQGGNVYLFGSHVSGALKDTIVADGTAGAGTENCFGALTSQGHNLEDRNECGLSGTGDHVGANAELGQLGNHGGPTDTMALLAGSQAINGGDPAGCTDPFAVVLSVDQRGFARPQGQHCDIGAFEFRIPVLSGAARISGRPQVGRTLTCLLPAVQSQDGAATTTVRWLRGAVTVGMGKPYVVKAADAGHQLRCRVGASNPAGPAATTATSAPVTVPVPPTVAISSASISSKHHSATFKFVTHHATGAQCALAKGSAVPRFSACTSPKTFSGLAKGSYTFAVRAVGPGGVSAPVKHSFKIS